MAPSLVARLTSENPPTSTAQNGPLPGCPADQLKSDDNSAQKAPHWLSNDQPISGVHIYSENRNLDDKMDDTKAIKNNSDSINIFVKLKKTQESGRRRKK